MSRVWVDSISPKAMNDMLGVYENSTWHKQCDRCWISDDGFQVCSRLIRTEIGNVEHATIQKVGGDLSKKLINDGSLDIPWSIKQEIKNEIFGKDRTAIEVFPEENRLIDDCDVYHLWILPKKYKMPFGIHPKDTKCSWVNRGCLPMTQDMIENSKEIFDKINEIK